MVSILLLYLLPRFYYFCHHFYLFEALNNCVFKGSALMTVITVAVDVLSYQTTLFESADG